MAPHKKETSTGGKKEVRKKHEWSHPGAETSGSWFVLEHAALEDVGDQNRGKVHRNISSSCVPYSSTYRKAD
jgi:hypothetical protein